jgi:hypothetical protein
MDKVNRLFGPNLFDEKCPLNAELAQARLKSGFVILIKPSNGFVCDHDEVSGMALHPFAFVLLEYRKFLLERFLFSGQRVLGNLDIQFHGDIIIL